MTDDEIAITLCGGPMDGTEMTTSGPSPAAQLTLYYPAGATAVVYRLSSRRAGDGTRLRYDFAWQGKKGGQPEGSAVRSSDDQKP
ncbi:hypothetical protein [Streptomyces sp. NPDC056549]|uniref:hypothetical protein n=1 Tax=Streptomyces sp. NPDC056549 TaxID=3345864 RepID=UPI0036C5AD48